MPTQQEAELLLDRIVERKQSMVAKVDLFIEQIKNASYRKENETTQDYVFTDNPNTKKREEAEMVMEEEFGKAMPNTKQPSFNRPHISAETIRKVKERDLRLQNVYKSNATTQSPMPDKTEKAKLEEQRRDLRRMQFEEKRKSTIVNTQKVLNLNDVLRQQQILQQQQQINLEEEIEQHHGMSM